MRKGDLKVGVEYAISADRKDMGDGWEGLRSTGYGNRTFPFHAVRRIRVVALDVPVQVRRGFRAEIIETKKMIQVEWLKAGIRNLDRGDQDRLGRFVHSEDSRYLVSAGNILGPWDEFAAEYERRIVERSTEKKQNAENAEGRDKVLAKLADMGIEAREGRGYSFIEIKADDLHDLILGGV